MKTTQFELTIGSATLIRFVGPLDVGTQNPLDNTEDGATGSFTLYNDMADRFTTAVVLSGSAVIPIGNVDSFAVGDIAAIFIDPQTVFDSVILSIDSALNELTITAGVPSDAPAKTLVALKLGPVILMTEYGTPVVGSEAYGFQGTILGDHDDLRRGQQIRIEMTFEGTAEPGTLAARRIMRGFVSGGS